jgi:hypothetical protein
MNIIDTVILNNSQLDLLSNNIPYYINISASKINPTTLTNFLNLLHYSDCSNRVIESIFSNQTIMVHVIKNIIKASYLKRIYNMIRYSGRNYCLIPLLSNKAFEITEEIYLDLINRYSQFIITKDGDVNEINILNCSQYFPVTMSAEGITKLGTLSYQFGYYDIFVKCVELGFNVSIENIIIAINLKYANVKHMINKGVYCPHGGIEFEYRQQIIFENMVKIMLHTVNNFKYVYKFSDLQIGEICSSTKLSTSQYIENLIKYCSGTDSERESMITNCYKSGTVIRIQTPIYDLMKISKNLYDVYYNYLTTRCHNNGLPLNFNDAELKKDSKLIIDYFKNPQITLREMFKHSTIAQIKKYYSVNKDKVQCDNYCINHAYIFKNNKLISYLESINKGATLGLVYILYVKKEVRFDTDYTRKLIRNQFPKDTLASLELKVDGVLV